MTDAPLPDVARIRKVTIENFRGFKGRHVIDTDADLVLLTGPNGHGKTSFLEALGVLLTGWHGYASNQDLISRDPAPTGNDVSAGPLREAFQLTAAVTASSGAKGTVSIGLGREDTILPMPQGVEVSALYNKESDDRELSARLCAFFQDRVDILFDKAAKGQTFRDVFEPLPADVAKIELRLGGYTDDLERERTEARYSENWTGTPLEKLNEQLGVGWKNLAPNLQEFMACSDVVWPESVPIMPGAQFTVRDMDGYAQSLIKLLGGSEKSNQRDDLRDSLVSTITNFLEYSIRMVWQHASENTDKTIKLSKELNDIRIKLGSIGDAYPHLQDDIKHFSCDGNALNALDIFRILANHIERWRSNRPDDSGGKLAKVFQELELVNVTDTGKRADDLASWLDERLEANAKRKELERERERKTKERDQSRNSALLEKLKSLQRNIIANINSLEYAWREAHKHAQFVENTENRKRALAFLDSVDQAIESVKSELGKLTEPSKELMEELRRSADKILWRFSTVEGIRPLKLVWEESKTREGNIHRLYDIRTGDGRLLQNLSTGQRAQFAVSLLVAQNQGTGHFLNHRIILLDDVTTAYDLSNLTREAILWRQFAYGDHPEDSPLKRQIFISSHHEDMTNHLLDLLVPPQGKSMRLIRFTGWSNETGPSLETYQVEAGETPVESPSQNRDKPSTEDSLISALGAL